MAITLVGQVANSVFATSLTATRTTTAGNTLIAEVQHTTQNTATLTDTAGNTWTLAGTTSGLTTNRICSIYYCISAASVTSVTVTVATTSVLTLNVSEWTGITTYRASNALVLTSAFTAPVTATTADLVVGVGAYVNAGGTRIDTLGAGWTRLTDANVSNNFTTGAYKVATTAGSQGPTWTGSLGTTGLVTAAFYGTVSNTPPSVFAPGSQRVATGGTASLTMTANDPDGTIASATWVNTSRPTGASAPTLTMSGSPSGITATTSVLTVPGFYTFTPSATDDFGTTVTGGPATVFVYNADGSASIRAKRTSTWTLAAVADLGDSNDATYAESSSAPANEVLTLDMNPVSAGDLVINKFRARLQPTGGAASTCKLEILTTSSDTVCATRTVSLTDAWVNTTVTLTSGENTAFTNHSIWAIRLTANQS